MCECVCLSDGLCCGLQGRVASITPYSVLVVFVVFVYVEVCSVLNSNFSVQSTTSQRVWVTIGSLGHSYYVHTIKYLPYIYFYDY